MLIRAIFAIHLSVGQYQFQGSPFQAAGSLSEGQLQNRKPIQISARLPSDLHPECEHRFSLSYPLGHGRCRPGSLSDHHDSVSAYRSYWNGEANESILSANQPLPSIYCCASNHSSKGFLEILIAVPIRTVLKCPSRTRL